MKKVNPNAQYWPPAIYAGAAVFIFILAVIKERYFYFFDFMAELLSKNSLLWVAVVILLVIVVSLHVRIRKLEK